jgi:hypothetical protein
MCCRREVVTAQHRSLQELLLHHSRHLPGALPHTGMQAMNMVNLRLC